MKKNERPKSIVARLATIGVLLVLAYGSYVNLSSPSNPATPPARGVSALEKVPTQSAAAASGSVESLDGDAGAVFPAGPRVETPGPAYIRPLSWSMLMHRAERGDFALASVNLQSRRVTVTTKDGKSAFYTTFPPDDGKSLDRLAAAGVDVEIQPVDTSDGNVLLMNLITGWLPIVVFALLLVYWLRLQRSGAGVGGVGLMGVGRTRSRAVEASENPVRFSDVAGCDEAKAEVAELVDFLRRPEEYARVGARGPQGVLMSGPSGTGKTLLAKAIAGEAGVPFFSASGSDFIEMFVGVGASRIRDLFAQAKLHAPAIVFIDEIDAVGRHRATGGSMGGGHDEREQTLNALLVEMDGFASNAGVVVIAATNRPDVLDPALRRPGRFDREVAVPLPDRAGRARILAVHAARIPVDPSVDWEVFARGVPGFSGADLANVINEAAIGAVRRKSKVVALLDLEEARDKIMLGVARKGGLQNPGERKVVAYHEAGHAVVAHFSDNADPVHKVTILPRGQTLGVTMQLPEDDVLNHDKNYFLTQLKILMGGRAAEDVALATSTVGASNDFHRANELARRMVAQWGMSSLGPVVVNTDRGWQGPAWSNDWLQKIDDAVATLVRESYEGACALLRANRQALDAVAAALQDQETLDAEAFGRLVAPAPVDAAVLPRPESETAKSEAVESKNDKEKADAR